MPYIFGRMNEASMSVLLMIRFLTVSACKSLRSLWLCFCFPEVKSQLKGVAWFNFFVPKQLSSSGNFTAPPDLFSSAVGRETFIKFTNLPLVSGEYRFIFSPSDTPTERSRGTSRFLDMLPVGRSAGQPGLNLTQLAKCLGLAMATSPPRVALRV